MLTRRHTLTAAVVMLCAALTGCEAADVGSPAPTAAGSLAPAGSPVAESPAASPSAAALPSASASAASAAPGDDLASLVPATINDVPVTVSQVDPASLIGSNDALHLQPVLQVLGKTPADLEVVAGGGGAGTNSVIIQAVRINGTDASGLSTQLTEVLSGLPNSSVQPATVGGKDVLSLGGDRYAYVSNDVLFFVSASNDEMAQATLQALP